MAHPVINLIKSPDSDVIAAYNCIEFCYEITDNITTVGTEAFLDLQVDAAIASGQTMTIFGQQFLFTAAVNDDGHKIAIGSDEFEQRDFIYDTLLTNYEISRNFDFAKVSTDRISFTAKKKGIDYNINFSSTTIDLQINTANNGIDSETRESYKVIGSIQIRQNGEWVLFDEEVRDVVLVVDNLGNFKSEVCFKLHGILRNYFKNEKPNLQDNTATINEGAVFDFRFGIVDFKATIGEVSTSGYFDRGSEIYCVLNGMHKPESQLKLKPYYENENKGVYLSLNQIPYTNTLCTDNNSFLSIFVRDKNAVGFGIEVVGDVYFQDGTTIYNHVFTGFSGIGSSVVVLPIGPRNIEVCNDAIWNNNSGIVKYNYRAFIYSNVESENLFVDGDNGTFQADIADMTVPSGIVKAQDNNGYVGKAIKLSQFYNATLNPLNQFILEGNTAIAFVQGNVYFLEAWIKVLGMDCRCLENLFTDAHYGTFDGLSPMDVITIISGATSSLISGYDNKSLMIKDLQASGLVSNAFLMYGDTTINFRANEVFEITAWVKVTGIQDCLDCLTFSNLFVDGDNGQFEGFSPWSSIIVPSGVTQSAGAGNSSAQSLQLSIGNANIVTGVFLFYGDSEIQFLANKTYKIKMQVKVTDFDCNIFGNMFVDGDNGTFEANQANITTLVGITQSTALGYPSFGTSFKMQDIEAATLAIGSILMYGASSINFQANTTYAVSMRVKAIIDPQLFNNMFVDGDNGIFESGNPWASIIPLSGITQGIGLGYPSGGQALVLSTLDAASISSGDILFYGDTVQNFIAGLTYILTMKVYLDDIDCTLLNQLFLDGDNGSFEANANDVLCTVPEYLLSQSVGSGRFGGNALIVENLVSASVANGDYIAYGDTFINFVAGETYKIKAYVDLEGAGLVAASADATGVKFIMAFTGALISIGDFNVISHTDVIYNSATVPSIGGIYSEINFIVQFNVNIALKIGVRLNLGAALLAASVQEIYFDDIQVQNLTTTLNLEANLLTAIGANGTATVNNSLEVDYTCSQQNAWYSLQTTFVVTTSFTGKVGLKASGFVDLLNNPDSLIFVDNVELLVDVQMGLILQASLSAPIGANGTQTIIQQYAITNNGQDDVWSELQTQIAVTNNFSGNIGLRIDGLVPLLKTGLLMLAIDNISVTGSPVPIPIKLVATLVVPIGLNGSEILYQDLILESTCAQVDTWVTLETNIECANDILVKVGLKVIGDYAYLLADTADVVDILVDNVSVYEIEGSDLELRMSTVSNPFGTLQYQQTLKIGNSDCPINEWVQLKTILTKANSTQDLKIGLEVVNDVACLMNQYVEVVIDNIQVKSLSQSGVIFEIITTEDANVMQNFELNNCEELGEWRKITSIYIPTSSSSEKVRISAKNMQIGCLSGSDVEVFVDEIMVRGYNDAHASLTPEQTIILKDDCDCNEDCCNTEFAYRNELGQFDFIHLECITQEITNVEMSEVDTCKDCDDDISAIGSKTINATSKKNFVINARITKERSEQFSIFISSIEKYHVVENRYYPVKIKTAELPTFKKASNYIDVDIEFEYKFENPTLIA